jgi:hypothetical protein
MTDNLCRREQLPLAVLSWQASTQLHNCMLSLGQRKRRGGNNELRGVICNYEGMTIVAGI